MDIKDFELHPFFGALEIFYMTDFSIESVVLPSLCLGEYAEKEHW
jgi:hypothetical protein